MKHTFVVTFSFRCHTMFTSQQTYFILSIFFCFFRVPSVTKCLNFLPIMRGNSFLRDCYNSLIYIYTFILYIFVSKKCFSTLKILLHDWRKIEKISDRRYMKEKKIIQQVKLNLLRTKHAGAHEKENDNVFTVKKDFYLHV